MGREVGREGRGGREKSCLKRKCLMKSNHPRPILIPGLSFSSCHLRYGKARDTAGARKQNGDLGMRLTLKNTDLRYLPSNVGLYVWGQPSNVDLVREGEVYN